ncbi:helix-turn-helix domain-containing protein [Streptomyces sp. NPDC058228]|uniref:helix-turn-helix domain-containing protein n=1 Tax=Streptomyces sp. NPDC058228 TaxID=3346390 RepID=UPI0036DFB0F3
MSRGQGRPMMPIEGPDKGIGKLARELRRGRSRRGLTRRELAAEIGRSVTTVQRAEAGQVRPPWPVAQDIAAACGMDVDETQILWKKASRPGHGNYLTDAPHLHLARTLADLAAALRRIWEENGEPTLRQMEERAEGRSKDFAPLSRMTAWRIRERKQKISSVQQLHAYLIACEVPEDSFASWTNAWRRVRRNDRVAPVNSPVPDSGHPRRRVAPAEAVAFMMDAGLRPLDPFPGQEMPWTAECRKCKRISRVRYSRVRAGETCRICR